MTGRKKAKLAIDDHEAFLYVTIFLDESSFFSSKRKFPCMSQLIEADKFVFYMKDSNRICVFLGGFFLSLSPINIIINNLGDHFLF